MASCDSIGPLVQAFSDGQLDMETQALVQHHLTDCASCCQKHFEIKKGNALLQRAFARERLSAGFAERVSGRLFDHEGDAWTTAREFAIRKRMAQTRRARRRLVFPLVASLCLVFFFGVIFTYWRTSLPSHVALSAAPEIPRVGTVGKVEGQSEISVLQAGRHRKVPFGYGIYSGSKLATGPHSRLAFVLSDDSRVKMNEKTILNVNSPRSLQLLEGEITVEVMRQGGDIFQVETANARIIVTGTRFHLLAKPSFTEVRLMEGKLVVLNHSGYSLFLEAGESARIVESEPPTYLLAAGSDLEPKWAENFSVGADERLELLGYDDGTPEGGMVLREGKAVWVTFNARKHSILRNLWVYGNVYSFDHSTGEHGRTFDIIVYDQEMKPMVPEMVRSYNRFPNTPGWTVIELPPINVRGKFHIAIYSHSDGEAGLVFATDDDALGDYSRIASFGKEGLEVSDRSPKWMVRATVKPILDPK